MTDAKNRKRLIAIIIGALAVAAAGAAGWEHWQGRHDADHGHAEGASLLTLNAGQKWETDAALRKGMREIHAFMEQIGSRTRLSDEEAAAISSGIQERVTYMITNCKLDPKADAVLHVLIADILKGAESLPNQRTREHGIALIRGSLVKYPTYFNHPGWEACSH